MRKKWTEELFNHVKKLYSKHSWQEISKSLKKEFGFDKTPNAVRKAYKRYDEDSSSLKRPKVLIYDIETAPLLGYVWGMYDNNLALNQVHTDWHVLSWSAKWLGDSEDKIMYQDQRNAKNIEDDSKILKTMWKLLDEADIVITQNGKTFDQKKLNARFVSHGFPPPSSYRHIDTVQLARKHFGFTSNKLEYLTNKLCTKYKKSKHARFSGFELWKECLAGNDEAWYELEHYNKYDVLSLEELYTKLIPWDNGVNFSVYNDLIPTCSCGSTEFKKHGFHYTNSGKYQKYKCTFCDSERKDRDNLLSKKHRK